MAKDEPIGVITEQGDLGLGFNPVSEDDQESLKEQGFLEDSEK